MLWTLRISGVITLGPCEEKEATVGAPKSLMTSFFNIVAEGSLWKKIRIGLASFEEEKIMNQYSIQGKNFSHPQNFYLTWKTSLSKQKGISNDTYFVEFR